MRGLAIPAASTVVVALAACHTLLDIDDIEFGDTAAQSGGTGGTSSSGDAASSASATGQGGGGGAGLGGAGGAPLVPENCANGIDDNDDMLVDCMDPTCACVDAFPSNWSGPAVLYRGPAGNPPACPADWPTQILAGKAGNIVGDDPAMCSGCSCGAQSAITCPPAQLTFYTLASCSGTPTSQTAASPNTCTAINGAASLYASVRAAIPTPMGGTCPPSGGQATISSTPSFTEDAVLCFGAMQGTSCAQGPCVPLPPPPFGASICIYRASGNPCPAPFTVEHTIYDGLNDTRGCSACNCPRTISCNSTTTLYNPSTNTTCLSPTTNVPHDNVCRAASQPGSMRFNPGTPTNSGCSATGGQPNGGVSGTFALRVCCMP